MRLLSLAVATAIVLVGCVSLEDTVTTQATPNVTYAGPDGLTLNGYLALPDTARTGSVGNQLPAVLMIHEWWGLNQDVTLLADALAAEGFVVLAPDAFRGGFASTVPQAILMNRSTPVEQIYADLDAALAFLMGHDRVDRARVATMGFCFGGRQSMHLGTRTEGLAAVITLYGSGLITDPAQLGRMADNAPVLGIFGEDDSSIPLRDVEGFGLALSQIGARHTISIYPGVGHAFVKSSNHQDDDAPGRAWREVIDFLNREVKNREADRTGADGTE